MKKTSPWHGAHSASDRPNQPSAPPVLAHLGSPPGGSHHSISPCARPGRWIFAPTTWSHSPARSRPHAGCTRWVVDLSRAPSFYSATNSGWRNRVAAILVGASWPSSRLGSTTKKKPSTPPPRSCSPSSPNHLSAESRGEGSGHERASATVAIRRPSRSLERICRVRVIVVVGGGSYTWRIIGVWSCGVSWIARRIVLGCVPVPRRGPASWHHQHRYGLPFGIQFIYPISTPDLGLDW
jgi:hypothetical protein